MESVPDRRSGAWVFKDTRMPVSTVFENLESGATIDEIMEWFDVTREQVVAVLEFAARSLDAPPLGEPPAQTADAHSIDAHSIWSRYARAPDSLPQGHAVTKARDQGWDRLSNGELLKAAEAAGFDLLLTTDKRIRYQQNLTGRKIAIVVLGNSTWRLVRLYLERVASSVNGATPGSYVVVDIPFAAARS